MAVLRARYLTSWNNAPLVNVHERCRRAALVFAGASGPLSHPRTTSGSKETAPLDGLTTAVSHGDVAVMELVEGPVSFVDTQGNRREGQTYLKPVATVRGGVPFGKPYQQPFSVN